MIMRKPTVITAPPLERLLSRLRFRQLEMVIAIVEAGSLRAAAVTLRISQPAVSKSLDELESTFGFPLFERSTRGLRPTAEGTIVVAAARAMIDDLEYWRLEATRRIQDDAPLLRLGAPPSVMRVLVPPLLAQVRAHNLPIRIELTEARVRVLIEDVLAERLDVLLTSVHATVIATPEARALRFELVHEEEQAVVAVAGHRLARASRVAWRELRDEPWVLPDPTSFIRQIVDSAFVRAGLTLPPPAIQSFNPATNLAMVRAGLGLSVVPRSDLQREPELVELKVHPGLQPAPIGLLYRAGKGRRRVLQVLREAIAAAWLPTK